MQKDTELIEFQMVFVDVKEYFLELIDDLYIQALVKSRLKTDVKPEDIYTADEIGDLFDEIRGNHE